MYHHIRILLVFIGALVLIGQGCVAFGGNRKNTALGPAGVFVSTNNGDAWTQIVSVPTPEGIQQLPLAEVYKLVEDPQDPQALYWASREHGMLYSYNDGRSWSRAAEPLNTGFVYSISVHPMERCTIYVSNGRQILKTTDCSRSWREVFRENRPNYVVTSAEISPTAPYEVYAVTSAGDVLVSRDAGGSWSTIVRFNQADLREVMFDRNKEGYIYLASRANGLYRSMDNGQSWENLSTKFREYAGALQYRRMHVYPSTPDHIYWISKYGILLSKNAGDDWEALPLVTPPGSVDIYGFAVNPRNEREIFYTGSIEDRSTFYRSTDGGTTWETRRLPTRQIPTALRIHPTENGWVYLGFTILMKK